MKSWACVLVLLSGCAVDASETVDPDALETEAAPSSPIESSASRSRLLAPWESREGTERGGALQANPPPCHVGFATGLPHENFCACQADSADPTVISCIPWANCDCQLGGLCTAPDVSGCASCAAVCPSGCWARFPLPPATCNCLAASECQ